MKIGKQTEDVNIYETYLKDISRYGTIDGNKMREYLITYKNGTQKEKKIAKERLVGSLQRFVLSIANKFSFGNNLMDIIGEGNIGLMKAIETYDINSEVKFTTYATYWVRKTIMAYITFDEPMVKPRNAIKLATYVPKITQEFWNKNSRQPTTEEIQEILYERYKLNVLDKEDLISFQPTSIDEKYESDDDGQEFMENNLYTSRTAKCDTDSFVKNNDEKTVVNQILSKLSDRDAYIIKCIYGIDCEPKSMGDVAVEVGISNERVRQIAVNGVTKLGERFHNLIGTF
jgi:RNA polymerase primary sigma factor